MSTYYERIVHGDLRRRLLEPRGFIQVLAGLRQVGKTTLGRRVVDELPYGSRYASADEPSLKGPGWIDTQWIQARKLAGESADRGCNVSLSADVFQGS